MLLITTMSLSIVYSPEFIASLKARDHHAFAKLYEDTVDMFYRYLKVHYHLDETTIQDIISQSYLKLRNSLDTITTHQHIHSYLWTILKNTTYDTFKKHKEVSFSQLEGDGGTFLEETLEDTDSCVQDLFEQSFQSDRIKNAMEDLDEIYKDVLFCKYILEYSHKEIADHLSISEENVRQRLSRWLVKLRKLLQ